MISLVCPMFNESDALVLFFDRCIPILSKLDDDYEFVCVNDGSTDNTLEKLLQLREHNPRIRIIDFSRNFGKEAALSAGIDYARGDAIIPIDVDLQDPPELIVQMINKWREGYDVVQAKRANRDADTFLKRASANWFYKLHNRISALNIPENVGDYRLIDRKVVDALKMLPENQRFMKGLFAWVGFKTCEIEFTRSERSAGASKFNGWGLWNFALQGITSFSTAPLRIWTYLGALIAFSAFGYGLVIVVLAMSKGIEVPGYASLLSVVLFIGGVNMIGLGILGEYIGRIYLETKRRPLYIVSKEY